MNICDKNTLENAHKLLQKGDSIRKVSSELGLSKNTVKKYKRIWEAESGKRFRCRCGLPSSHQGWCSHRYNNSIARQSFIEDWTSDRPRKIRPFNYRVKEGILQYPYLQKNKEEYQSEEHKLLIKMNEMIPKKIPLDLKSDLCQDLILAILSKELTEEEVPEKMDEYIKRARSISSNKWQNVSFDGVVKGTDDMKYSDILGHEHDYEADYDSCCEG